MNRFERIYLTKYPYKYYERKIAISFKERGQENKRFSINEESLNLNLTLFDLPCRACALPILVLKKWLDNLAAYVWGHKN